MESVELLLKPNGIGHLEIYNCLYLFQLISLVLDSSTRLP